MNDNHIYFNWQIKIRILRDIADSLKKIHEKDLVHHDLHTGNILFNNSSIELNANKTYISDIGSYGEVGNVDKTKVYGVMPYVAPEVLRGKPYTQAADIYSFGMIMYFVATGKQPFHNRTHDHILALDICDGNNRPEINVQEAPKCYIGVMKKCWEPIPENRPNITQLFNSLHSISTYDPYKKEIEEAEEYRKLLLDENTLTINHPQAIYTSRLLNAFTDCLDYVILN
jgi:serine/threonine protein kinase